MTLRYTIVEINSQNVILILLYLQTLRLDPLGNVPDANTPLEGIEPQRVVVTRFIYDDDVEAARAAKKKKS